MPLSIGSRWWTRRVNPPAAPGIQPHLPSRAAVPAPRRCLPPAAFVGLRGRQQLHTRRFGALLLSAAAPRWRGLILPQDSGVSGAALPGARLRGQPFSLGKPDLRAAATARCHPRREDGSAAAPCPAREGLSTEIWHRSLVKVLRLVCSGAWALRRAQASAWGRRVWGRRLAATSRGAQSPSRHPFLLWGARDAHFPCVCACQSCVHVAHGVFPFG